MCGWRFETVTDLAMHAVPTKDFPVIPLFSSRFLAILEEMFPTLIIVSESWINDSSLVHNDFSFLKSKIARCGNVKSSRTWCVCLMKINLFLSETRPDITNNQLTSYDYVISLRHMLERVLLIIVQHFRDCPLLWRRPSRTH